MLIRFAVENAYCFSEEASISMVASKDASHPNHVRHASDGRVSLLRAAAIYGANAHGKTNLVNAIRDMQYFAIHGPKFIPRFKLETKFDDMPTKMVAEFRYENEDFEYGLVVRNKIIEAEWLYLLGPNDSSRLIFERETLKELDDYVSKVTIGDALREKDSPLKSVTLDLYVEVIATALKEGKSFLSEGGERDVPLVETAFRWFNSVLFVISADATYADMFDRLASESSFAQSVQAVLNDCDVGIASVGVREGRFNPSGRNISSDLQRSIDSIDEGTEKVIRTAEGPAMIISKGPDGETTYKELFTQRRNARDELVDFRFTEESSGTRRMLDLAPIITDRDKEAVYVVDELDRKLHPLLAYNFIKTLLAVSESQLLFTTHNTFLMNLDLLRKDEIWFVQKRKGGGSSVYALAEYKFDPKTDIRNGYFEGRFGAIPFIADTSYLGWDEAELNK